MNILIVLGLGAFALCLLWAAQSIALIIVGEPLAWPFRFSTTEPLVRWTNRVMIHVGWLIILIGTPLALGISLPDALHKAFPTPVPWHDIAVAFSVVFFISCIGYALYFKFGWIRFEPQGSAAIRRGKLVRRLLGPLPVATLEEGVFRGVVLEQLLQSLPQSAIFTALAIALTSATFSLAHFVKPKQHAWQATYGYFIVGCLFGLAYVVGGRSLWLPIVVHATAVFVIEMMRLYGAYQGPPWLVGHREWPQSGLIGSFAVLCMGIVLVCLI